MGDITLGQIKKAVHVIMTKYYDNSKYRHCDLIRKVLRKLNIGYSQKNSDRVRTQLRNWIISKNEIARKENADSKKGILSQAQKKKKDAINKAIDEMNKTENSENRNSQANQIPNVDREIEVPVTKEVLSPETVQVAQKTVVPAQTQLCSCSCTRKSNKTAENRNIKIELVDLTENDFVSIKKEDNDMYDINAVIDLLDDYYTPPAPPVLYILHV